MIKDDVIIEGRKVQTWRLKSSVGDYVIYQDKIWNVVAAYGIGKGSQRILERAQAGERITIGSEEWKSAIGIIPQGHISI